MAHYIVYWPQDWVQELKKAGDQGPIQVVLGSIHSRMPTIVSVKVGDVIYPVTLIKKKLCVMARLPVTHKERAFDYCMWELGTQHSALAPEGVALEHEVRGKGIRYYAWDGEEEKFRYFNRLEDVPAGLRIIPLTEQVEKPHLKHQEPFNCCSEWAAWGEDGSSIEPRLMPDEAIPLLRFGYPKSKEKPLRLDKNGNVLSMSLAATRRISEETVPFFEQLF